MTDPNSLVGTAAQIYELSASLHTARRELDEAADALADSVPREQYDKVRADLATSDRQHHDCINKLHEARAERDALAHVIEQAPHADTFCTAGEPYGQAECVCWKATNPTAEPL